MSVGPLLVPLASMHAGHARHKSLASPRAGRKQTTSGGMIWTGMCRKIYLLKYLDDSQSRMMTMSRGRSRFMTYTQRNNCIALQCVPSLCQTYDRRNSGSLSMSREATDEAESTDIEKSPIFRVVYCYIQRSSRVSYGALGTVDYAPNVLRHPVNYSRVYRSVDVRFLLPAQIATVFRNVTQRDLCRDTAPLCSVQDVN